MDFKDLDNEALASTRSEKHDALQVILGLDKSTLSPAEMAAKAKEAKELAADIRACDAEAAERAEAESSLAALASEDFSAPQVEVEVDATADAGTEDSAEADPESGDDNGDAEADAGDAEGGESTSASTEVKTSTVKKVAANSQKPRPPATTRPRLSIVAAAGTGYEVGQSMGLAEMAEGVVNRLKGFPAPNGDGKSVKLEKHAVASIEKPFDPDLVIDRHTDSEEVMEYASRESRLPGNSLVASLLQRQEQYGNDPRAALLASNGWCSPSETMYDLQGEETLEGILDLPEVQIRRGGIRYTMGPQFADFYANAGFVQTETQAIAGDDKPCYEVTCPTFTDVRLDAVGVCIKVPILLNAAYPEMTQRFTSGTLIAHEHMKNANVIGRIVTASGAARVFAGLGSAASDALEALELAADQRRQTYRLSLNHTLEVVVPFWLRGVYRSDLGRRSGRPSQAVTDQEITAHFAARNLAVRFVYDWQVLDPTVEVYPPTYQVLIYPAGTFVKGTSQVINLSAVYDAASLAENMYTGMFVEEGLLVAKKKFGSDLLTLPICTAGRTGANNLTCA